MTEIEIDHIVGIDKDTILDPITGHSHKTDIYNMEMTIGEETIDAIILIIIIIKIIIIMIMIIIIKMTVEIEGDKTLGEASVMIEADQEKEA